MIINPMIVKGQVHRGFAQGVGQALKEDIVYDGGNGRMLTASSWTMPCRAPPSSRVPDDLHREPGAEQPARRHRRSERGAIDAPAAIGNAVIDALWHLGVRDISLPIASRTVWRAS